MVAAGRCGPEFPSNCEVHIIIMLPGRRAGGRWAGIAEHDMLVQLRSTAKVRLREEALIFLRARNGRVAPHSGVGYAV